ncbi:tubulin-specific chaperone E isoform X2 [Microcaecilia unicolor]|nr:tubulin-specific chaperone E isoform X2 [Microcaecilia unicolor]
MMNSTVPPDAEGRRIICDGDYATVRYVGYVPPTPELWLGVEWDNPQRGKHNGCHQGTQYFVCRHPTGGSFIRPKNVCFGVDFITAVKNRYGFKDKQSEKDQEAAAIVIGKKTVELVGFQRIQQIKNQLNKLTEISLRECAVYDSGQKREISQMCPTSDIVSLNLSKNLLPSWDKVAEVACQLKKLEILDLSENKLRVSSDPVSLSSAFINLRVLSLNGTGVTWTEVLMCSPMWPLLEDLYLASNNITVIERPVNTLQSLRTLDLFNNKLIGGTQLQHIAYLPRLEQLMLSNTGISSIHFPDVGHGCKSAMFPSLRSLAVNNNKIAEWSFINELDKLQCLQSLICKNNPLMESNKNIETMRQLIIAKIGNLKFLDKSEILPKERQGAELDYRKIFGNDWLQAGGHQNPEKNRPNMEFLADHPRYELLCKKYGAPEDGELKQEKRFTLKNQLLTLTIECPDQPNQKPIEKKLPDSMTVQKVKGLLHRLLKVPGSNLRLSYKSAKMESKEIELQNDLKSLAFYSIENGDCILARW